ncbi:MAG TPA: hypothetical protein VEQ66_08100 [Propionibacteriaceae bacterium]|nr:hypothetical protein [Propionibacteriaceae bacterium]
MSRDQPPRPYADTHAQLATATPRMSAWSQHLAPDMHRVLQRLLTPQQSGRWWNGASVFLAMPGDVIIASAVTTSVTAADELQLRLDQGPALHTIHLHEDLLVDDTSTDGRWSAWASGMSASGWRSVLTKSVGSLASGAALCIYAHRPRAFSLEALVAAEAFAGKARSAVAAAMQVLPSTDEADDPEPQGVTSDAIVRIMDHHHLDLYEAFEFLCGLAQAQQAELHVVAAQIMAGRHGLA